MPASNKGKVNPTPNSALSIHVRSEDGKHLNGRISLTGKGSKDIPTPAHGGQSLLEAQSLEALNSVALAAEIYSARTVVANQNLIVPVRYDFVAYDSTGVATYKHIQNHHFLEYDEEWMEYHSYHFNQDLTDAANWHNTLHAREIDELLSGKVSSSPDATSERHHHARDLSESDYVEWTTAGNLLQYALAQGEMTREMQNLPEEEGRESLFQLKLEEAKSSGLYDSIRVLGVTEPILVISPKNGADEGYPQGYIYDGYHRLSAAMDIDLEMIVPFSWA